MTVFRTLTILTTFPAPHTTWMVMTRTGDQATFTPPSTISQPCQGSEIVMYYHILTNNSDNNKNMTWSKIRKVISLNLLTLHKLVFVPGSEPQKLLCPEFSHLSLLIAGHFLPPLHIIICSVICPYSFANL